MKTVENQAIVATDLTNCFGEGEARMTAVNRLGLVAHFSEMLLMLFAIFFFQRGRYRTHDTTEVIQGLVAVWLLS
jgi:hypothetical protein